MLGEIVHASCFGGWGFRLDRDRIYVHRFHSARRIDITTSDSRGRPPRGSRGTR
jgi:hypothetical protein